MSKYFFFFCLKFKHLSYILECLLLNFKAYSQKVLSLKILFDKDHHHDRIVFNGMHEKYIKLHEKQKGQFKQ